MLFSALLVATIILPTTECFCTPNQIAFSLAQCAPRGMGGGASRGLQLAHRSLAQEFRQRPSCRSARLAGGRSATLLEMALVVPGPESDTMKLLRDGIKAVGVGVKGSKPIPDDLVDPLAEIITALFRNEARAEWQSEEASIRQRASSFLGTLFVKVALLDSDRRLLEKIAALNPGLASQGRIREGCSSHQLLAAAVAGRGSKALRVLALKLLDGETLSVEEAQELGSRFFDDKEDTDLQVLCMHLLRVRYETLDEWYGLVRAQDHAIAKSANSPSPAKKGARRVVQLAEPFDGTDKADSFAPLVAKHLQDKWGCTAISQCGATSGPKYGPNLYDLAKGLHAAEWLRVHGGVDRDADPPMFGWFVDQAEVSEPLERWRMLRRNIIKRPFLATSEKFVDTHGADVIVASAFHPSFGEKMFQIADNASRFKACIIIRKGTEGSIGMSLARPAEFIVGVREGIRMKRYQFEFGAKDVGVPSMIEKDQQCMPSAASTAAKIASFAAGGESGDPIFDDRVKVTCAAMDVAMAFVERGERLKEEVKLADIEGSGGE